MIVCDKCTSNRVSKDGDICNDCKEILRPKTILDYLRAYHNILTDYNEYRIIPDERWLQGLEYHIDALENNKPVSTET